MYTCKFMCVLKMAVYKNELQYEIKPNYGTYWHEWNWGEQVQPFILQAKKGFITGPSQQQLLFIRCISLQLHSSTTATTYPLDVPLSALSSKQTENGLTIHTPITQSAQ